MNRLRFFACGGMALACFVSLLLTWNAGAADPTAEPPRQPLFRLFPLLRPREDDPSNSNAAKRNAMRPPLRPKSDDADEKADPLAKKAEPPGKKTAVAQVADLPAAKRDPAPTAPATQEEKEKRLTLAEWPKPQLALVFSGNQGGYIEPCGCTGLEHQKGGLARRATFIKQLVDRGWDLVPVDAGNQVRRFGRQAEMQFQHSADALKKMNYRAVGLGVDDLRLSDTELIAAVADNEGKGPFVSANVAVIDRTLMPEFLVFEAGPYTVGVTSILGDEHIRRLSAGGIVLTEAEAALAEITPKIEAKKCDLRILLAYTSVDNAIALARKFPHYQLVVAAGDPGEPAFEPERIEGTKSSYLIRTGAKGMYVSVLGLFQDDPKKPWRYERVALDSSYKDSPDMRELFASYQDQLKISGLEGLGVKPLIHPTGRKFVGTHVCGECHTKALAVWEKSPHAHATDSIVKPKERGDVPRHFDPECLSCHTTGWDPQKYFPFTSGFEGLKKTPHMMQNGCENCHGPGNKHVEAETAPENFGADVIKKLREEMRLPLDNKIAERKCMECHDIDNSPDFHQKGAFEEYWKQVEHKGKD